MLTGRRPTCVRVSAVIRETPLISHVMFASLRSRDLRSSLKTYLLKSRIAGHFNDKPTKLGQTDIVFGL